MLPPMLEEIRQRLTAKGYERRSQGEDALLDELTSLDEVFERDPTVRKNAGFRESRIVGGPSGTCSCCGR
jgi:hypothetical protein